MVTSAGVDRCQRTDRRQHDRKMIDGGVNVRPGQRRHLQSRGFMFEAEWLRQPACDAHDAKRAIAMSATAPRTSTATMRVAIKSLRARRVISALCSGVGAPAPVESMTAPSFVPVGALTKR